jgi:hypothetical protein
MPTTELTAVLAAARALANATRFGEALTLLDTTEATDAVERLGLLMARAEVVARQDHTRGVPSSGDHPLDTATALARELGTGPTTAWDLAMLHLRRQYADQLLLGFGPAGRDLALVDTMVAEARRLRDSAPDDGRRGWALMCLGWIDDNLRGDRVAAPSYYLEALAAARTVGDDLMVFEAQRHLGDHAHDAGDHGAALAAWEESTEAAVRAGHVSGVLAQQLLLAVLARDAGDEAGAVALAREVGRWSGQLGAVQRVRQVEEFLAGVDPTAPPQEVAASR